MMDILDAYDRLTDGKKGPQLPKLHRGDCVVEPTHEADPDAIWRKFVATSPTQGWLQFQSRQMAFYTQLPDPQAEWGLLLAAEATTAEGDSIGLGLNGAGGWVMTRYRRLPEGDLLYDEPTQRAHDPQTGALRYRRWWRYDPEQGYVQAFACFIGFEKGATV